MLYRLVYKANTDLVLIPDDLAYFPNYFVGKRLPEPWNPPNFTIYRKHRPVRDFVSWMLQVPVISERALSLLTGIMGTHVQVLKIARIKKVDLYAINVLTLFPSLDSARKNNLPICKIQSWSSDAFVNEVFVRVAMTNKLYGAAFVRDLESDSYIVDPQIDDLDAFIL